MAEEDVVAFPVKPSDHNRKLEDLESEVVLEQHAGSIHPSNEFSLDDCEKASDYSQAKRTKVDDEAANGLGERPEESKEDGNGISQKDENQEPIHAEESENKMDAVDVDGKPEDNQPASVPAATSQEVSVEESNDDSTSASMTQKNPEEEDWKDRLYSGIALDGKNQKSLEGIRILLAEDTPVHQRIATIMLEKMGATVTAVGDGQQAVDSLNYGSINAQDPTQEQKLSDKETINNVMNPQSSFRNSSPYDLILMDCQMPKMDGYEATKAIRRAEIGTELHIPIVALTANAMSSDKAKCLEVGMDAYLTKPIDRKLMVSTILSLTKPSISA